MNRRDFLALLASAPIAALAPWPQSLKQQIVCDTQTGIAIRFVKQWDIAKSDYNFPVHIAARSRSDRPRVS